jgi:hypothetical protein
MPTRCNARIVPIVTRFWLANWGTTLRQLANHIDDAAPAPTFDRAAQVESAATFHTLAADHAARDPGHALDRIAERLDRLVASTAELADH